MKDGFLYVLNFILDIISNIFFALYIFIGASVITTMGTAIVFTVCFVIIQLIQGWKRYAD